jgi:probable rRNA maturation factor
MSAGITVDVQIACKGDSTPGHNEIRSWVVAAIEQVSSDRMLEVSVRIVDEDEGRQLNNRFRGQDKATNVLSFPADDDAPGLPADEPRSLGDIVICGPVVAREAAEQGKAVADHWAHMLVHGSLHLLGYDHDINAEAEQMEALEQQILAQRGIGDPYAT